MSGGAPSKTTTTTELPKYAQPYAESLMQRSAQLSDQQMPVYTGPRSAAMNGYQIAGNQMTANRALNGSAEIQSGSRALQNTLNGGFLSQGNPYLSSVIDRSAQDVTRNYQGAVGSTDATFARNGAFGGSAWQNAQEGNARQLAQGLGDLSNQMRYQDYSNERNNMMQAMPMALQFGNQAYMDAQQLDRVGGTQYAYDQQLLDDSKSLWEDFAQSPYKQLDILANGIRGAVGGGGTVTQSGPRAGNPLAQAVGGGAALYGLLGN